MFPNGVWVSAVLLTLAASVPGSSKVWVKLDSPCALLRLPNHGLVFSWV